MPTLFLFSIFVYQFVRITYKKITKYLHKKYKNTIFASHIINLTLNETTENHKINNKSRKCITR